jgi:cytochrome c oxidase cbb3-type subunit III
VRTIGFVALAGTLAATLAATACDRETRSYRSSPPAAAPSQFVRTSELQPGATLRTQAIGPYQENRWAVSEGQRLYNGFNCVGCHANGGGGIGPPLADRKWIYGSDPEQVFATIVQGRPNGMPAYGGKLGNAEVWRLVAYVRALGKLTPPDTWPARADNMSEASPVGNGRNGK